MEIKFCRISGDNKILGELRDVDASIFRHPIELKTFKFYTTTIPISLKYNIRLHSDLFSLEEIEFLDNLLDSRDVDNIIMAYNIIRER